MNGTYVCMHAHGRIGWMDGWVGLLLSMCSTHMCINFQCTIKYITRTCTCCLLTLHMCTPTYTCIYPIELEGLHPVKNLCLHFIFVSLLIDIIIQFTHNCSPCPYAKAHFVVISLIYVALIFMCRLDTQPFQERTFILV